MAPSYPDRVAWCLTSTNPFFTSQWPLPYLKQRKRAFFDTKDLTTQAKDWIHDLHTGSPMPH